MIKVFGHKAPDTDAIATLGILRGTGLALQSAAAAGIDRYYIDHAYFNPVLRPSIKSSRSSSPAEILISPSEIPAVFFSLAVKGA